VKPVDDIAGCATAHHVLMHNIIAIDDGVVRRPSRLPNWTVGHVLSHLARNADSHVRRLRACARGEVVDQYPGGFAGRAAEIAAGATRRAADIVADVRDTIEAFDEACAEMPDDAWPRISRDVGGVERAARDLPSRRWQEVEVHHVDLELGYTHADWPDAFVAARLPHMAAKLSARLAPGTPVPSLDLIPGRDALAWLFDRIDLPGMPALAEWG
jgi:maleylpyruvate isomerase